MEEAPWLSQRPGASIPDELRLMDRRKGLHVNYDETIAQAKDVVRRLRYYEYLDNVLYYDRWSGGSPYAGFSYGQEVNGFVVRQKDELLMSADARRAVVALRELDAGDFANPLDRGVARWLIRRFDEAVKVPSELTSELCAANAEGQREWAKCLVKKDFRAFLPTLKRQFDLQEKIANSIDPDARVYDTIMARCDPSYTCAEVDAVFDDVKRGISGILAENEDAWAEVDATPVAACDEGLGEEEADSLVALVPRILGADSEQTTRWRVHHPVTVCTGPRDGRPSTYNYGDAGIVQTLRGMAHETGHSLYGCGSSDDVVEAGLWGGIEGFMHESQSRFYENHVFRSEEFWSLMLPELQGVCLAARGYSVEEFTRMVNKPAVGASRLKADELTYPMHIIIRHEIERDYFDGKLSLEDIEDAWNAKYRDYLGVVVENAAEGVLSDVHWASGCVGYFFSYALGDLYAAQFDHALRRDVPDAYARLAAGDPSGIKDWLGEHVWASGQLMSAPETLISATGEELNARYYVDYLKSRFSL